MKHLKKEKQKNKTKEGDVKNLDHRSDITNKPQKVEQQEKAADSTTTTTVPEVFDSSKYNTTETKEATSIKEGNHLQDVLMNADKEEENKQKEDEKQEVINKDYPQATFTWPNLINAWSDLYIEAAKNVAMVAEYWINPFSKPWPEEYKKKDKVKVE